ncbi:regulator of Ty1 Transposition [Malassezia cuniculi]|uniref:Regulator of Ty1 Transposition n=1 Tax=Malassezia cuniculi TaxID=948313 RepID=A0AAF0EN65_9BASI|nr:regulator of Ty1 Transposition [Malassezia cuniculi]
MIFSGVVVTCAGLSEHDAELISAAVASLGGGFKMSLCAEVTHVIALSLDTSKVIALRQYPTINIPVVAPHWINDCFSLRRRIPIDDYVFNLTKNETPNCLRASWEPRAVREHASTAQRSDAVLEGRRVLLARDIHGGALEGHAELRSVADSVVAAGGSLVDAPRDDASAAAAVSGADIVVTRFRDSAECRAAIAANVTVGSLMWLISVLTSGVITAPRDRLLHFPYPKEAIPGFDTELITITRYTGKDRAYLKDLIAKMGGTFTPDLTPRNTVCVALEPEGDKVTKAHEWNIPVVNHTWLEACFATWKKHHLVQRQYISFPGAAQLRSVLGQVPVDDLSIARFAGMPAPSHTMPDTADESTLVDDIGLEAKQEPAEAGEGRGVVEGGPMEVYEEKHLETHRDTHEEAPGEAPEEAEEAPEEAHKEAEEAPAETYNAVAGGERGSHNHIVEQFDQDPLTGQVEGGGGASEPVNVKAPDTNQVEEAPPAEAADSNPAQDLPAEAPHEASPAAEQPHSPTPPAGQDTSQEMESRDSEPNEHVEPIEPKTEGARGTRRRRETSETPHKRVRPTLVIATTSVEVSTSDARALHALHIRRTDNISEATHLVAENLTRTEKMLCAIARGTVQIVTYDWIREMVQKHQIVDAAPYALHDAQKEAQWGMRLDEALARAQKHPGKLLDGHTFYYTRGVVPSGNVLRRVIEAAGGTAILATGTAPARAIASSGATTHLVSCMNDKAAASKIVAQHAKIAEREGLPLCGHPNIS